jgi:hypothetical protein
VFISKKWTYHGITRIRDRSDLFLPSQAPFISFAFSSLVSYARLPHGSDRAGKGFLSHPLRGHRLADTLVESNVILDVVTEDPKRYFKDGDANVVEITDYHRG